MAGRGPRAARHGAPDAIEANRAQAVDFAAFSTDRGGGAGGERKVHVFH